MGTILAVAVLIVVSFAFWGVGAALERVSGSRFGPWPVSIGVGLAATVVAGGFLNLARVAYAPALWAVLAIETAICVFELRRVRWNFDYDGRAATEIILAGVLIGVATIFAIATQLPPKAFNSHDDFEKYFAYPARMLQTGTLAGSPLSALGSEVLGGQTLLHAMVLSIFPIGYINGVDAVFCMAALMLLLASAGWRRSSWFPVAIIGPLLVAAINPQYVNVTALYSGAFLMATLVMLVSRDEGGSMPSPLVMGIVCGAIIAVKVTFVVLLIFYFPFVVMALRKGQEPWNAVAKWSAKTAAWAAAFVSPWILIHVPNYISHGSLPQVSVPGGPSGVLNPLSMNRLFYGGSFLAYSAVAILAAIIGTLGFMALPSGDELRIRKSSIGVAGAGIAGALAYIASVIVMGKAFGYAQSLRLSIPFLLGPCAAAVVMSPVWSGKGRPRVFMWVPVLGTLGIVGAFLPSAVERYQQAARYGSILAFSDLAETAYYAGYNAFWLSPQGKDYIQKLQEKVPAGEPLLAWINTPFLLDYKRNRIVDADTVGLASPWAHVPPDIRYVLWEYRGPEVRMEGDYQKTMHGLGSRERLVAARSLDFAAQLSQAARNSEVIGSDNNFVLFKLRGPF